MVRRCLGVAVQQVSNHQFNTLALNREILNPRVINREAPSPNVSFQVTFLSTPPNRVLGLVVQPSTGEEEAVTTLESTVDIS